LSVVEPARISLRSAVLRKNHDGDSGWAAGLWSDGRGGGDLDLPTLEGRSDFPISAEAWWRLKPILSGRARLKSISSAYDGRDPHVTLVWARIGRHLPSAVPDEQSLSKIVDQSFNSVDFGNLMTFFVSGDSRRYLSR
jgi:hypothetical protein